MLIKKVILEGYRRFLLNPIKKIVYTPTTPLQIILGTNGSGKSSLLYELSVLPAITGDYDNGGSKKVFVEHENSHYELTSVFNGSSAKHSFKRDSVELNDSGTLGVQKELVFTHFRYTFEIHDVLIGRSSQHTFTGMTTADRKKWLTLLSKTDLSMVTKAWKDLVTLTRDGKGVLKHLSNRIATETLQQLSTEDKLRLEHEVDDCKTIITVLMESKTSDLPNYDAINTVITQSKQELEALAKRILQRKITKPENLSIDNDQIDNIIFEYKQALGIEESMYAHYCKDYAQLDSVLASFKNSDTSSLEELDSKIKVLDNDIQCKEKQIHEFVLEHGIEDIFNDTKILSSGDLITILRDLPVNKDCVFNQTQLDKLTTTKNEIVTTFNLLSNRKNQLIERLEHIKTAHSEECPKCKHKWIPGVNLTDERDLIAAIEQITATLNNKQTEIETITIEINTFNDYLSKLANYKYVVKAYPRLHTLWNKINNREIIYDNPEIAVALLQKWIIDVDTNYTLHQLRNKRNQLQETLEHVKIVNSNDPLALSDRVDRLQQIIEQSIVTIKKLKENLQEVNQYKDALLAHSSDAKQLQKLYEALLNDTELINNIDRNKTINKLIEHYQTQLAVSQKQLTDVRTTEGIINDLNVSFDKVTIDTLLYNLLSDAVGPVEGIIAEYLSQVIQVIVHQLNSVISSVWTVPLYIQDCGMTDGEVDYLFPMCYETSDKVIPDVKYGSSAQVDIVNFAFKLLVYTNLELLDYPLYVDEIGISFDETHRQNLMSLIRTCIEGKQFSQTFMISHYADQYKAFISSETLVLDNTNITVPFEYNKHVNFE